MSRQWIQVCCFSSSSHTRPFLIGHFRSYKLPRGCTSESTVWIENEPDVYILKQRHTKEMSIIFKGVTSYIIYIFWGPLKMLQKLHQKSQISCSNTIFHGLVAPWNLTGCFVCCCAFRHLVLQSLSVWYLIVPEQVVFATFRNFLPNINRRFEFWKLQ